MWVKSEAAVVNLDWYRIVCIDDFLSEDERPRYSLVAKLGTDDGEYFSPGTLLKTYDTLEDAKAAYGYLHQCLALNAALCDLPGKGASKL